MHTPAVRRVIPDAALPDQADPDGCHFVARVSQLFRDTRASRLPLWVSADRAAEIDGQGRHFRLTDVAGSVVRKILA